MARRRSRSLSGSPEHHAKAAESLRRLAKGFARETEDNAKLRNCEAAFESLIDAVSADAKSAAHLREATGSQSIPVTTTHAENLFYKACVLRRKGVLSGLGASPLPKAEGIDKKGRKVKLVVKKDREWNEWQVRVYVNGKFSEAETGFHGSDKSDALESFAHMKASYGLAGMRKRRK